MFTYYIIKTKTRQPITNGILTFFIPTSNSDRGLEKYFAMSNGMFQSTEQISVVCSKQRVYN